MSTDQTKTPGRKPFLPTNAQPMRTSVMLAITYGAMCLAYIFVSSYVAGLLATSKIQLTEIEFWKGTAFVFMTSAIVFSLAYSILRRVADRERELARNREALVAAERRALAGVFASAVAHDINNTMSVLHDGLDQIAESAPGAEATAHLRTALDGLQRMTAQLLQTCRDNNLGDPTSCDLAAIVRDAVSFGRIHSRIRNCRIEERIPSSIPCHAHPGLLRQMVLNLLLNAAEATAGTGKICVELKPQADGGLVFSVCDDGPGIPPDYQTRLFQPFFTTKPSGTGLGLLSVKAAAQAHGGTVGYQASALGGACFRVRFPARFLNG